MHSKQVNPVVETFDILHLQEVSLRNRLLDLPKKIKNTRPAQAPINKTRKGGNQRRKDRKFLDKVLKYGAARGPNVHESMAGSSKHSKRSQSSKANTNSHANPKNDVMSSARPKLRDPLLKLQKRYFSPFFLRPGKQRLKSVVTLATNLLDHEAKKKTAHH